MSSTTAPHANSATPTRGHYVTTTAPRDGTAGSYVSGLAPRVAVGTYTGRTIESGHVGSYVTSQPATPRSGSRQGVQYTATGSIRLPRAA